MKQLAIPLLLFLLAPAAMAQVEQELQVNTYTTSWQYKPDIEALGDGGFVVVWRSQGSPGTDTHGESIQARRFDSADSPNGDQFQVNESTLGNQQRARILRLRDDSLVVTWIDKLIGQQVLRRLSADGTPNGSEILLGISDPDISLAPTTTGGFVVASRTAVDNPPMLTVNTQIFDAAGSPLTSMLPISEDPGTLRIPTIASLGDDGFIVVWGQQGVRGRRIDSSGAKLGQELLISSDSHDPLVASGANGEFFVGARRYGGKGAGNDSIVFARFDVDGNPIGSEWVVDDPATGESLFLWDMVGTESGSLYAALWHRILNGIGQGNDFIWLARFDQSGQALQGPYPVSAYVQAATNKKFPRLAVGSNGPKVVWQAGLDVSGPLGSGFGDDLDRSSIQLRTAFEAMFADGFETGSAFRWFYRVGN